MADRPVRVRITLPPGISADDARAAVVALAEECGADEQIIAKALRPPPRREHTVRALEDAERAFGDRMKGAVDVFAARLRHLLGAG